MQNRDAWVAFLLHFLCYLWQLLFLCFVPLNSRISTLWYRVAFFIPSGASVQGSSLSTSNVWSPWDREGSHLVPSGRDLRPSVQFVGRWRATRQGSFSRNCSTNCLFNCSQILTWDSESNREMMPKASVVIEVRPKDVVMAVSTALQAYSIGGLRPKIKSFDIQCMVPLGPRRLTVCDSAWNPCKLLNLRQQHDPILAIRLKRSPQNRNGLRTMRFLFGNLAGDFQNKHNIIKQFQLYDFDFGNFA